MDYNHIAKNSLLVLPRPKKGLLISIEGSSGSGKTTLVKNLKSRFSDIVLISEISDQLDSIPRDLVKIINTLNNNSDIFFLNAPPTTTFLLLSSLHFHIIESKIIPALAEDKVVICDRFLDSPALLQSVIMSLDKNISDFEILEQYIWMTEFYSKISFFPDFVFILNENLQTCIDRVEMREKIKLDTRQRLFLEKTNTLWKLISRENALLLNQEKSQNKIIELIQNFNNAKSFNLDN